MDNIGLKNKMEENIPIQPWRRRVFTI